MLQGSSIGAVQTNAMVSISFSPFNGSRGRSKAPIGFSKKETIQWEVTGIRIRQWRDEGSSKTARSGVH